MRVSATIILALALVATAGGQIPGDPFDECGIFQFIPVEGGCYNLVVSDGPPYEIYGDFTGLTSGDTRYTVNDDHWSNNPGANSCWLSGANLLPPAVCCLNSAR
jgi:hypothetical protein